MKIYSKEENKISTLYGLFKSNELKFIEKYNRLTKEEKEKFKDWVNYKDINNDRFDYFIKLCNKYKLQIV